MIYTYTYTYIKYVLERGHEYRRARLVGGPTKF